MCEAATRFVDQKIEVKATVVTVVLERFVGPPFTCRRMQTWPTSRHTWMRGSFTSMLVRVLRRLSRSTCRDNAKVVGAHLSPSLALGSDNDNSLVDPSWSAPRSKDLVYMLKQLEQAIS